MPSGSNLHATFNFRNGASVLWCAVKKDEARVKKCPCFVRLQHDDSRLAVDGLIDFADFHFVNPLY